MKMTFFLGLLAACLSVSANEEPNIVVMLADDLGFADVGYHGCTDVPLPHIDSIAKGGVLFTEG